MKKYYPVDFDEKGNAVLGNAKSNPTSNGFISTTWAPGGSDEGKQGLKSISISPAITTTPTLDAVIPRYYEAGGINTIKIQVELGVNASYTVTVTPTPEWYVYTDDGNGEIGEAYSFALTTDDGGTITAGGNFGVSSPDDLKYIEVSFAS